MDCLVLVIFSVIFLLRALATLLSQQVKDNNLVLAAGHLYGINTLVLSFRVFGHVLEQLKKVGIIQITLINILFDICVLLGHFALAILAFSFSITKAYVAEKSFSQGERNKTGNVCEESEISCWWAMLVHLTFLIFGLNEFNPVEMSLDTLSEILALVKYVIFLMLGVILLKSLMVSLMTETFRKTRDNSEKEWSYKRAITIVAYCYFDPIPVPLNVFYTLYTVTVAKCKKGKSKEDLSVLASQIIEDLETDYFAKYQNSFPLTAEEKVDRLLYETQGNRQIATQIICQSLHQSQASDYGIPQRGPEAWSIDHRGLQIEGCLLTCKCDESFECVDEKCFHGAKYYRRLTESFPYFEVVILETGKRHWPGIGLVHREYELKKMPGWERASLGYHTDDGKIYRCTDAENNDYNGKETKGYFVARRGDLIRFTAMFEKSQDGKVPVFITLNGKKIATEDGDEERLLPVSSLYPYVCLTEGCSVSALICRRENGVEPRAQRMAKIETQLEETNRKLDIIMQSLRYESVV